MIEPSTKSLEIAAQCWCDEETSAIEMDSRLAIAFAKRLDAKEMRIAELEKDIAFLQSCVNSGESATKADRPSERVDKLANEEPYVKCYPDVMGATHTGDDNLYYKYTSNGYMLLEDGEWDYVTYLPDLRRLDDIRTTVSQKYKIKDLEIVIEDFEKMQNKMFDLLED